MARLEVYQNLSIHMKELAEMFMLVFDGTSPTYSTRREAAYSYADGFFSVYGVLDYDANGDLSGGLISRIEIQPNSGSWIDMSKLKIDVASVLAAVQAENSPGGEGSMAQFVYGLDWIIVGRYTQDSFIAGETNSLGDSISFSGNDTINLAEGQDSFFAGDGDDVVNGGSDNDTLSGGSGRDTMSGGNGRDIVEGDKGADVLFGNGGKDRLSGAKGNDTLDGGSGHDYIKGGQNDDLIRGGAGHDRAIGGSGADVFLFVETDSSSDADRILDFENGIDQIQIDIEAGTNVTVSASGGNTLISYAGNTILVEGIDETTFSADADHLLLI